MRACVFAHACSCYFRVFYNGCLIDDRVCALATSLFKSCLKLVSLEKWYRVAVAGHLPTRTVTHGTVFVCLELWQAVNRYGLFKRRAMVNCVLSRRGKALRCFRDKLECRMRGLASTRGMGVCHCVQMLDVVQGMFHGRVGLGRRFKLTSAARLKLILDMVDAGLCPKASVDGIPEWLVLRRVCSRVAELCRGVDGSYSSLVLQCLAKSIPTRHNGRRLSKRKLRSILLSKEGVKAEVPLCQKRKYKNGTIGMIG